MNQPPQPSGGASPQGPYNQQPNQQGQPPQPHPGQYAAGQQAPYQGGQQGYPPQGQGYPQGPQGYPQGPAQYPHARPPVKRGPSKFLGLIKIVIGGLLALGMIGGLMNTAYEGYAVAALFGVFFGAGVRWVFTGGANLIGKKLPLAASIVVLVVAAGGAIAAGPPMSNAFYEAQEEETFNYLANREIGEYGSGDAWDYQYFWEYPAQFHRPEAKALQMRDKAKAAVRDGQTAELRRIITVIATEHKGDELYSEARKIASDGLANKYDLALAKLAQPGAEGTMVDENLRDSFKTILADFSEAPSPEIHVAFTNTSDLTAPEGHEKNYNIIVEDPSVKRAYPDGNVHIIQPGTAFSSIYDSARRQSFMEATSSAFEEVFDANLLTLTALEDGQSRDGKYVLEVSSNIVRSTNYFNFYNEDELGVRTSNGILFGIGVEWSLTLFSREGEQMYGRKTFSLPGSDIGVSTQPGDPEWAVYSILMDSAYYNYAREVVANFGLEPPAQRRSFAYRDYGAGG